MREGSLEAPTRHAHRLAEPVVLRSTKALEKEMERVFDICHGCRRCFNLCDSFPRLFDLIDNGPTGELDGVKKEDYAKVEEACTLCDMCFMTKCPYVPPHDWMLDFPHLMLRHRAVEGAQAGHRLRRAPARRDRSQRAGSARFAARPRQLGERRAQQADAAGRSENVAGIHHGARLPKYAGETFVIRAAREGVELNEAAPAFGKRKAVLYATCFVNYNNTGIGAAARAVLAKNGVETEVVYPRLLRHAEAGAGRSRSASPRSAAQVSRGAAAAGSTRATTSSR